MLEYTLQTAIEAENVDKIIISTDCTVAARTAESYNIEVPFLRPQHLAQDHTPTFDVIEHAINFYEAEGVSFDQVVLLQPTVPFRKVGFVDDCIRYFENSEADSFCSVEKVPHQYNPHWVFKADENGFLQIATGEEKLIPSRQLLPEAFVRDGSVYIFRTEVIKEKNNLYGDKITYLESDNQWHINIDTKEDWNRAEMIANLLSSLS